MTRFLELLRGELAQLLNAVADMNSDHGLHGYHPRKGLLAADERRGPDGPTGSDPAGRA